MSIKKYKNIAMILAAGRGARFSQEFPKQYVSLGQQTLLRVVIEKFLYHKDIDAVVVGIDAGHLEMYKKSVSGLDVLPCFIGGATRQETVLNGLRFLKDYAPENVLIHDAARVLTSETTISNALRMMHSQEACVVVSKVSDTIKKSLDGMFVDSTVSRENLFLAETPQVFKHKTILQLHERHTKHIVTDDSMLCEKEGVKVSMIESDNINVKLTNQKDLILVKNLLNVNYEK